MDISFEVSEDILLYEIGDWANALLLGKLVNNFDCLPKLGQDVITTAVIRYVMQAIIGADDETDAKNIKELFNNLIN